MSIPVREGFTAALAELQSAVDAYRAMISLSVSEPGDLSWMAEAEASLDRGWFMRRLVLLFVVALSLAGCGSGGAPTGPGGATGTLAFTLDPVSCADRETDIELFVDSASQGVFHFAAGDSKRLTVAAGPHVVSAKESGGAQTNFGTRTVTVPRDGVFTFSLQCG